jgi:hypothetical protein
MGRSGRRRVVARAVVVAVLGGLALAGCQQGTKAPFEDARAALRKAGTASFTFSVDAPGNITVSGTGPARFGSTGELAVGFAQGGAPNVSEVIVTGRRALVKDRSGSAKPWHRMAASAVGSDTEYAYRAATRLLDPMALLRIGVEAERNDENGAKKGSGTDHYTASCDWIAGTCSLSDLGALGRLYPDSISATVDVWLDGKGRPVRLRVSRRRTRRGSGG